jgi:hypothetical protein
VNDNTNTNQAPSASPKGDDDRSKQDYKDKSEHKDRSEYKDRSDYKDRDKSDSEMNRAERGRSSR